VVIDFFFPDAWDKVIAAQTDSSIPWALEICAAFPPNAFFF